MWPMVPFVGDTGNCILNHRVDATPQKRSTLQIQLVFCNHEVAHQVATSQTWVVPNAPMWDNLPTVEGLWCTWEHIQEAHPSWVDDKEVFLALMSQHP